FHRRGTEDGERTDVIAAGAAPAEPPAAAVCPASDRQGTIEDRVARHSAHTRHAAPAETRVAQGPRARIAGVSAAEIADARAEPPHGVRGGAVPEHRRVLAPRDGDVHDPRR